VQQGSTLGAPANHGLAMQGDLKCIGGRKIYNYVSQLGIGLILEATVFICVHSWKCNVHGYFTDVDKGIICASGISHLKQNLFWQ